MQLDTKKDLMKKLGENIKMYRMFAKLTQEQLAEKCDCSAQTISGIETGYSFPSFNILLKLSETLDVPLAYFFNFDCNQKIQTTNIPSKLTKVFDNLNIEQHKIILKIMQQLLS